MRVGAFFIAGTLGVLLTVGARADDGGGDASDASSDDADVDASAPPAYGIYPTTTADNYGCSAAPGRSGSGAFGVGLLAVFAVVMARRRRLLSLALPLALLPSVAHAAEKPALAVLDAPTPEPPPPMRRLVISYNPFTLAVSRYGGNVELTLASHHVLEGTLFYAYTHTNADSNNIFQGVGAEVGYRYYFGREGPRGLYIGPSFLMGFYDATGPSGEKTSFQNFGGAVDAGYQAIVADRVVVGLGFGAQYTVPSIKLAQQELPASVYANAGFRPRLLLALGVAF